MWASYSSCKPIRKYFEGIVSQILDGHCYLWNDVSGFVCQTPQRLRPHWWWEAELTFQGTNVNLWEGTNSRECHKYAYKGSLERSARLYKVRSLCCGESEKFTFNSVATPHLVSVSPQTVDNSNEKPRMRAETPISGKPQTKWRIGEGFYSAHVRRDVIWHPEPPTAWYLFGTSNFRRQLPPCSLLLAGFLYVVCTQMCVSSQFLGTNLSFNEWEPFPIFL